MKTSIAGFEVELARKRVKNLSVRIMPPAGEIRISAPYAMPETTIAAFLTEKRAWIEKSREKLTARAPIAHITCSDGELVFVEGTARRLTVITVANGIETASSAGSPENAIETAGSAGIPANGIETAGNAGSPVNGIETAGSAGSPANGRSSAHGIVGTADCNAGSGVAQETVKLGRMRVSLYPEKIVMSAPSGTDAALRRAALDKLLKVGLSKRLAERFPVFEELTGLHPTSVIIRDMHTRYGTCNTKTGRIAISLTLAAKPPVCVDYVILHELSHLRYPDHGALFKAHLDRYMPHWREIKKLLNSTPENTR